MQVKNEYVKVKTKGREYVFKNWIYDSYLKLFSDCQKELYNMQGITESNSTELSVCCIKIGTALEDYKNANVSDFDIFIPQKNSEVTGNENSVNAIYNYSSLMINYANKIDLSQYDGQKITAIGFCGIIRYIDVAPVYELYACIDTNYYSIYVNAEEGINISRKDIVSSNAVCDGAEYPLHLAPILKRTSEPDDKYKGARGKIRAVLYSVGFGATRRKMEQEFLIGEDAKIKTIDDFSYGIDMKNPVELPKYPSITTFPSSARYPVAPKYLRSIYPQKTGLYPSNKRYPMKAGYSYIIFKYRLYYNVLNNIEYLDEYYTMSYLHSPKGVFTIKNKIERG